MMTKTHMLNPAPTVVSIETVELRERERENCRKDLTASEGRGNQIDRLSMAMAHKFHHVVAPVVIRIRLIEKMTIYATQLFFSLLSEVKIIDGEHICMRRWREGGKLK